MTKDPKIVAHNKMLKRHDIPGMANDDLEDSVSNSGSENETPGISCEREAFKVPKTPAGPVTEQKPEKSND